MNRVPPQAQTYGFPTAAGLSHPGQQQQQQPGRAMASPQPPPPPNKGTLVPGQVLRVGKIQVTVERYLSEGASLSPLGVLVAPAPGELADAPLAAYIPSAAALRQAASHTSILLTRPSHCMAVVGRMSSSASPSGIASSWTRSGARSKSWCVCRAARKGSNGRCSNQEGERPPSVRGRSRRPHRKGGHESGRSDRWASSPKQPADPAHRTPAPPLRGPARPETAPRPPKHRPPARRRRLPPARRDA